MSVSAVSILKNDNFYFKTNTTSKIRPDKYNDKLQDGKHTTLTLIVLRQTMENKDIQIEGEK